MVVSFQDNTSKKICLKGNQGQGANYNWRTSNCIIHKLTSSKYVINMLDVLQFANGDIESHPHSSWENGGGFFFAKILLKKVVHSYINFD
jgi:hypothetical protein